MPTIGPLFSEKLRTQATRAAVLKYDSPFVPKHMTTQICIAPPQEEESAAPSENLFFQHKTFNGRVPKT
jgi:hypothetical protein